MSSEQVLQVSLADEEQMVAFGQHLGDACEGEGTVYLCGNLGMGKTTLCRGVLRSQGYSGAVKSPTYTLVEPYEFGDRLVYHFDLYRLADPEELEYLGIRDYFSVPAIRLIEWPDQGRGVLAEPDLKIDIEVEGTGRALQCQAYTMRGREILQRLQSSSA
ncbi:MAG: tRNA (adenosine(37)-N6)-threonylcarbamoyltransferase complex ATPase subunit type 1 TsaE [Motiliproteus sp.]|nr:tRNA (adenosine(37)-N6)-threonylcarbamoyltransferase complex ATPase subunit type 1 TsaE [Motiliproteus sp.]MCW9053194.1 tRNA (adenosine(37)-N6)-threonylcarbamoyltransferase complex ATPase subunit type 1 TsaE [Motiliproteus sp.]